MGALFGALSSLSVGMSEMFGRRGAKATGVLAVSVVSQGVAAMTAFTMLLWLPSRPDWEDLVRGAISGVGFGIGMVAYLGGLMRSSATMIAPMVATMTVVLPFGVAVVGGAETTGLALLGVGVALVGLLFITAGGQIGNHTSELQSHLNLLCRLLLDKKKTQQKKKKKYTSTCCPLFSDDPQFVFSVTFTSPRRPSIPSIQIHCHSPAFRFVLRSEPPSSRLHLQ